MADTIKLVKGDELPQITLTLTDDVANAALDLSATTTIVTIKFRLKVALQLYLQFLLVNLLLVLMVKYFLISLVVYLM